MTRCAHAEPSPPRISTRALEPLTLENPPALAPIFIPECSQAGPGFEAPLDRFKAALPAIEPKQPLAIHCQGGYRSAIACSLLQRAGYNNVINVIGGFDAWLEAQLPAARSSAVSA